MTSSITGDLFGLFLFFFSSSFFSLRVRALCLEKSGAILFTSFVVFPAFPALESSDLVCLFFNFLNLYFCWSYSTAPTAHRRQGGVREKHPERARRGGGNPLILCQRRRKRNNKGKKGDKEFREGKIKEGEKGEQYQRFLLEFSWFHTPGIDCFRQLQP